jgi:hypothetical protein
MIEFSIVPIEDAARAHSWHKEFVTKNSHILFLRTQEEFETFANMQQLWGASKVSEDQYVGQIYCLIDIDTTSWEMGGLCVAASDRRTGVGFTLACLALSHLLYTENPLMRGHSVVACVQKNNDKADLLMQQLFLKKIGPVEKCQASGEKLEGVEYLLASPATLWFLAKWCEDWNDKLDKETPAQIRLGPHVSLNDWVETLRDMEKKWNGSE